MTMDSILIMDPRLLEPQMTIKIRARQRREGHGRRAGEEQGGVGADQAGGKHDGGRILPISVEKFIIPIHH